MIRALIIFLLAGMYSCTSVHTPEKDYPVLTDLNKLTTKIHVVGIIREVRYGLCGVFCEGGYIKVELEKRPLHFNYRYVYLITACISLAAKAGTSVDIIATLHTGQESECYYENFAKPVNIQDILFYKLTEEETGKISGGVEIKVD